MFIVKSLQALIRFWQIFQFYVLVFTTRQYIMEGTSNTQGLKFNWKTSNSNDYLYDDWNDFSHRVCHSLQGVFNR